MYCVLSFPLLAFALFSVRVFVYAFSSFDVFSYFGFYVLLFISTFCMGLEDEVNMNNKRHISVPGGASKGIPWGVRNSQPLLTKAGRRRRTGYQGTRPTTR